MRLGNRESRGNELWFASDQQRILGLALWRLSTAASNSTPLGSLSCPYALFGYVSPPNWLPRQSRPYGTRVAETRRILYTFRLCLTEKVLILGRVESGAWLQLDPDVFNRGPFSSFTWRSGGNRGEYSMEVDMGLASHLCGDLPTNALLVNHRLGLPGRSHIFQVFYESSLRATRFHTLTFQTTETPSHIQ